MTNDVSKLLGHANAERATKRLQEMVRIPATTGQERPMAEYVARILRESGCDDVHVDDQWNVLGSLGAGDGDSLILLSHTDSGPAGSMANAFSGEIMDGAKFGKKGPVVFGRGASAPKAVLGAMIEAVALLRDAGVRLRGKLLIAAVTKDLQANHEGVKELANAGLLKAPFVIAGEPTNNEVVLGARGIAHYEIKLRGIPAHWGRPADAVNPLYGMAEVLAALERMQMPKHAVLGGATLSPFDVRAEVVPPRSPEFASLMIDRRLLPEETVEAVAEGLTRVVREAIAGRPKMSAEVIYRKGMFPYSTTEDAPAVQLVQRAAQAVFGKKAPTSYIAFATNAAYLIKQYGTAGVCFGPGLITDVTETEHAEVASMVEAAKVYAAAAVLAAGTR
jgi:acetylornithine deacetylase